MDDLLAQLRKVKTGQKIELRLVGPSVRVGESTGIRCDDEAAKAAYMQNVAPIRQQETDRLNEAVAAELRRIREIPPDVKE
jgi:hypothetical protein